MQSNQYHNEDYKGPEKAWKAGIIPQEMCDGTPADVPQYLFIVQLTEGQASATSSVCPRVDRRPYCELPLLGQMSCQFSHLTADIYISTVLFASFYISTNLCSSLRCCPIYSGENIHYGENAK